MSPGNDSYQIQGVCPHDCPDACGIRTTVRNGRAAKVAAQADHPVAAGWLCAKVSPYLERVYHADRLQTPLIRVGPKGTGDWRESSWDEAIGMIAARWKLIIAKQGASAILPYSYSGTLGLVQMAVASGRFWNRLGASRLQRSICMAATRHAIRSTLGARMSPPYHHVLDSKLLIFWGHNPVSTAPHLMPFVRQAQRKGCRTVVIDPLRSRTARSADLHIQPKPGTDLALALAVAHTIVKENKHNTDWLEKNTHGWPEFQQHIKQYDAQSVASICGIPAVEIKQLALSMSESLPCMIRMGDAVNRNLQGGQTVRAIACLPALLGQYGVRGGGLSCSTGDYFTWNDEAINYWSQCSPPTRMINMNRLGAALTGEVYDPPVHSLFVFCANPMVSTPNTACVKRGLLREDLFTVVHDLFMTDTARYADIVLPATSQLEQTDLHRGYGHTHLSYNHPAITPIGRSKSNWDVMRLLADAMGFNESWLQQSADEVIEEIIEATRQDTNRLDGISLQALKKKGSFDYSNPDEVPFSDLVFSAPTGKVNLLSTQFSDGADDALPTWRTPNRDIPPAGMRERDSVQLVSPAAHHFVNSSLANLQTLYHREKSPAVLLHPEDAERFNVVESEQVKLVNKRGYCVRTLKISEDIKPGVALALNGYWQEGEHPSTINWTTSDALADSAGQSVFQSNWVWIQSLE